MYSPNIQTCICAFTADRPHPAFHGEVTSGSQAVQHSGLLLVLTVFPLSPAKSLIKFSFASTNLPKCA